jgi:hypothetical protein
MKPAISSVTGEGRRAERRCPKVDPWVGPEDGTIGIDPSLRDEALDARDRSNIAREKFAPRVAEETLTAYQVRTS